MKVPAMYGIASGKIINLSGKVVACAALFALTSCAGTTGVSPDSTGTDTTGTTSLAMNQDDATKGLENPPVDSIDATGTTKTQNTPVKDKAKTSMNIASDTVSDKSAPAIITNSRLTNLSIEPVAGQGNVVIADASAIKHYSFTKSAPSEYVLNLEAIDLDPKVTTMILAEPRSGVIRSARARSENGNVAIRIFAQPTAELSAVSSGGKIIVKDASMGGEFMAQAKPELPQAAGKDAPAKDAAPTKKAEEKKADDKKVDVAAKDTSAKPADTKGGDDFGKLLSDDQKYSGRLISLDLQDTDIDNALRIIAEVSNLNIIASSDVAGKVTLRLIDVPWDQALDVILKTNGLDKVQEGNVVRIAPVEKLRQEREALKQAQLAEEELEPVSVKYVRISYAKAADLKPLLETVLTERGSVTFDERSNQIIIKDIRKGVKQAVDLVAKLDLRTPQVLLETQIVEAQRSLSRDLGAQLGFSFVQSPATGNATHWNFPNSISVGGGLTDTANISSFPATVDAKAGSAMSLIFGSADGTKTLSTNLMALEKEGRVRIVSRPAVATTNNKPAEISSNETILVKKPSGGNSTVVGGGGSSTSGSDTATEKIKAGITLKVTPQASPDYYVLLDIDANSSTFGSKVVDGIPSIIERKATSTVLVSSGQTFAIGGIYKLTDNDSVNGVPFLKDIPVLGHFFRETLVNNSDEELLFFITPRIVEGSFDDAAMTVAS